MKQFDIVLFGATSFVGQIMTRYLIDHLAEDNSISWAIAGRSKEKLNALKSNIGNKAENLTIIIADSDDVSAITHMCESAKVIVSTVGPYALYGEQVVKACVTSGTDYCDLTGEPQWIMKMQKRYEAIAKVTGARIVHCCGFDSIPSDLGVYFLQQQANKQFQHPCDTIKMRVKALKGGASGGTIASMTNLVKEVTANPELRKVLVNPYALCPPEHGFSVRQDNVKSAQFDENMQAYIGPFVMAAINTRVVHRTNALLDNAYGDQFKYDEAMVCGKNTKGNINATLLSVGLGAFMLSAAIPPLRWFMETLILPKPGEGPSESQQINGYYDLRFFGKTTDGNQLTVKVTGDQDPGYGSTAKMLSQAALCLVKDIPKENAKGGFWTPASLMGESLITRLKEHAGLTFSVEVKD